MPARLPHLRVHDDRAVDADHADFLPVRPRRRIAHHVLPPGVLDVLLQLDAERAVVPEAVDAAVDLARLEDEAAPAAQGDEFFHVHARHPVTSPMTLHDPDRADLDANGSRRSSGTRAKRSTSGRRLDVVIVSQAAQRWLPPLPTSRAPEQAAAVVLEAVPRQPGRVVQAHLGRPAASSGRTA